MQAISKRDMHIRVFPSCPVYSAGTFLSVISDIILVSEHIEYIASMLSLIFATDPPETMP